MHKVVVPCTFYVTVEVTDTADKLEVHKAVEKRLGSTPGPSELLDCGELEIDDSWEIVD